MENRFEKDVLKLKKISFAVRISLMIAALCCCIFLISYAIIGNQFFKLSLLLLIFVFWLSSIRLILLTYGIWVTTFSFFSIFLFPLLLFIILKSYSRAASLAWSKGFRLTLGGKLSKRAGLIKPI